jgi:hypothetical protein
MDKKPTDVFYCELCDFHAVYKSDFIRHNDTMKHMLRENRNNCRQKKREKNSCEICDYYACKPSDLRKHFLTAKHLRKSEGKNVAEQENDCINHKCSVCMKQYVNASGLWKHKKICKESEVPRDNGQENKEPTKDIHIETIEKMFIEFIKKNSEIQNILVEKTHAIVEQNNNILEKMASTPTVIQTNNNINNTTNNNQFNLNFFLNETCKDAMNITDFVNSMKLQISDFEETGRLGYVEGITKIFLKFLKEYDVEKRPMHCTDIKRETVYIKHNDVWEKEKDDKSYLNWAVGAVAQLNFNQHMEWQKEHPDCTVNNSKSNHEFMKLTTAALGGHINQDEGKLREKIMRNVLKEIAIEKTRKM